MYNGKVINYYNKEPMANVQVTDGMNIVYTDENGCFSLPGWEKANVISLNMLTNSHNDWFKNIKGHEGDFDFVVKPATCDDEFSFLHISDSEIEGRRSNDWIDFLRDTVKKESPMFFMNTGDLCREDGMARTYLLMNSETVGCPVRFAIGNHDMIKPGHGENVFEAYYGPTWYSFDCGKIHFVVLSIGVGDVASAYTKQERMEWLKKDLELVANDKGIMLFCHYFHPNPAGYGHTVKEVADLYRGRNLKAVIFGHDHYNYTYSYEDFLCICSARPDSGGIDSTPAGARKITVSGTELTSEYIYNIPESDEYCSKSVWNTSVDGNIEYSSPILYNDCLWVCTNDDGYPKKSGIYKLDAKNGNCLAFFKTGAIKGDAAISDGRFYAQDTDGVLYCIDTEKAEIIWTKQSDVTRSYYTRTGVFVFEDKVIAGAPSIIQAYNKDNGELLWRNEDGGCECPNRFVFDEKRRQLIVGRQWLGICAISIDSGEFVWNNKSHGMCWFNTSTPALDGDTIYKRGNVHLGKINASDGEVTKSVSFGGSFDVSGSCAFDENIVYIPTTAQGVFGIDKNTLEHKMTFPTGYARLFTPPYHHGYIQTVETTPIIDGEKLIFGASDGYVYIYNKNNALLIKKINVGSPVIATPYVSEGYIYTADFEGNVKKFKI